MPQHSRWDKESMSRCITRYNQLTTLSASPGPGLRVHIQCYSLKGANKPSISPIKNIIIAEYSQIYCYHVLFCAKIRAKLKLIHFSALSKGEF